MIKRIIALLCASVLIFCGCGDGADTPDEETVNELCLAINATNSETRLSGKYMLEMTFGDSAVLYYALGNVAWDTEKKISHVSFNQTYLGKSSVAENYFADGTMISVDDGNVITAERESDTLFSKFPYARLLEYSSGQGGITVSNSASGKTFTVVYKNTEELSKWVVGEDIYSIASVIKKPQTDKTQYGDTTCVYTVSDGKVVGCRYEFDIKLFDTPAYVPGYSVPESDYTLDIHVVAKMSYESFGEGVEISEYSEPSDMSEASK